MDPSIHLPSFWGSSLPSDLNALMDLSRWFWSVHLFPHEKGNNSIFQNRNQKSPAQQPWKTAWLFLKKLKISQPYGPATPLLGIYPREWKYVWIPRLIPRHSHQLCVNQNKKRSKSPSTGKWINRYDTFIQWNSLGSKEAWGFDAYDHIISKLFQVKEGKNQHVLYNSTHKNSRKCDLIFSDRKSAANRMGVWRGSRKGIQRQE